jgi:tetratricopeptide (TPR) repeat protein
VVTGREPWEDTQDAIALGQAYVESRNYRRAVEVLSAALVRDPQEVALLVELAQAQHFAGDTEIADRTIRDALVLAPGHHNALVVHASILAGLGRWRPAIARARRAVNQSPHETGAHYALGRILLESGNPVAALPVAKEVLRIIPDDADAHVLMGAVLAGLNRREQSIAEFQEALRLDPGNAHAVRGLGITHAQGRRFTRALSSLRHSANMDPALGEGVRIAVTEIIREWLSWVTIGAWLAINIAFRLEHEDEAPGTNAVARVVAGIGAVILIGVCGWVAHSLPPRSWWALLGAGRRSLTVNIYAGLCVVVAGALSAFAVGAPISMWVLFAVLMATVAGTWIAPYLDRDKSEDKARDRDQDEYRSWNRED